jgi:PmbA protein
MHALKDLEDAAERGLAAVKKQKDVIEAELYATSFDSRMLRLNYTSRKDMPCNGVHEPKNIRCSGVGLRVVLTSRIKGRNRVGFGYELGDISVEAVRRCLDTARATAVHNPHFKGLPSPDGAEPQVPPGYHDPAVFALEGKDLVDLGWRALGGTISEMQSLADLSSLIVGGDVKILSDSMALRSTKGMEASDEFSMLKATITCLLEEERVRGTGFSHGTRLDSFHPEYAGKEAARVVKEGRGARRIPSGTYPVIFGHQPITEFAANFLVPSLALSTVYSGSTPFAGKLGARISDFPLHIWDDGTAPGRTGTRRFTCEGYATGRADLVTHGIVTGFMTDSYYATLMAGKLREFTPRNGFRLNEGARNCSSWVGISPTNFFIGAATEVPREELFKNIDLGLFLGRLWYTYPIRGLMAGDFTSSVTADSWIIRKGRLEQPLLPNSVRINDNFLGMLRRIKAVSSEKRTVLDWGATYEVAAPEILFENVRIEEIGEPLLA